MNILSDHILIYIFINTYIHTTVREYRVKLQLYILYYVISTQFSNPIVNRAFRVFVIHKLKRSCYWICLYIFR